VRAVFAGQQILAGDDKAVLVARDVGAQPIGTRRSADEDEEPVRRLFFLRSGRPVGDRDGLQVVVTAPGYDLSLEPHLDISCIANALDKVLRH